MSDGQEQRSERTASAAMPTPDVVLDDLLRGRWSCRAFLPRPVPTERIERMLALAQRAPSWCNTQPWRLEVTSGLATVRLRRALRDHLDSGGESACPDFEMPSSYSGIHRERRRVSGWQLYDAVGVQRGDREASARQAAANFDFFGAPHFALIHTVAEQGVYGAIDGGAYLMALLLAAQSVGVAAVPQAAIANVAPFLREYFGLADDRAVLFGVSFGFADPDHPANSYRTGRAKLSEVLRHHDV